MSATPSSSKELSPEQIHRRQSFWQIYVPLALGVAVFLTVCIWVILFTIGYIPQAGLPDQQSPAAKVAVIWILLAPCFGGLIQLAILAGLVFGLSKAIHGLPSLAHQLHNGVNQVSSMIHRLSDRLARPVIVLASQKSGFDRFLEMLALKKHAKQGD